MLFREAYLSALYLPATCLTHFYLAWPTKSRQPQIILVSPQKYSSSPKPQPASFKHQWDSAHLQLLHFADHFFKSQYSSIPESPEILGWAGGLGVSSPVFWQSCGESLLELCTSTRTLQGCGPGGQGCFPPCSWQWSFLERGVGEDSWVSSSSGLSKRQW